MGKSDGKTEKPTERRRKKARREGTIAKSAEVPVALSFAGAVLVSRMFLPGIVRALVQGTQTLLASAGTVPSGSRIRALAFGMMLPAMGAFLGVAVVMALAGGLAQTRFSLAPAALKPKLSNLSLKKGLDRWKPAAMAWEGGRSAVKLGLAALVVYRPINATIHQARTLAGPGVWLSFVAKQVSSMLLDLALLAMVIAAVDYAMNRRKTGRSLRMSKQETRQENKEDEGDPMQKSVRRRRHAELSRNGMLREVAQADVVLMNPTHLAVALKYIPGEPAPRVVAKGAGELALKMRAEASRNGVMVREDKPLAREIFRRCRVGHYIPAALFEAVAIVLAAAYRRRRRGSM